MNCPIGGLNRNEAVTVVIEVERGDTAGLLHAIAMVTNQAGPDPDPANNRVEIEIAP